MLARLPNALHEGAVGLEQAFAGAAVTWHPELLTRRCLQGVVVLEGAQVGAVVHVGDAVVHGDVTHVGETFAHDLDRQVRGAMGFAVKVHLEVHAADVEHLTVCHRAVGREDLGAQGGLVGPTLHQAAPEVAFSARDLLLGVGQGIDGQVLAVSLHKGVVAQPVVTVVVAVEDRDHRQRGDGFNHANGHFADLPRTTTVEHHHAFGCDHKHDVGHHPLVGLGGETVFGKNHPGVFRQALGLDVGHGRAFDEVLQLLSGDANLWHQAHADHTEPHAASPPKPIAAMTKLTGCWLMGA